MLLEICCIVVLDSNAGVQEKAEGKEMDEGGENPCTHNLQEKPQVLSVPLKHLGASMHKTTVATSCIFTILCGHSSPGSAKCGAVIGRQINYVCHMINYVCYYSTKCPRFDYKVASDSIVGFEDHATLLGRTNKPAKYALVFMIQGLLQDWKQLIAAFFSGFPTNAERLKEILQMILEECSVAGLKIISTVCDMGSSNVKALKIMGPTPDRPVINVAGQEYITMFDTPHLLTSTRNLILKYHVRLPVEVAVEGSSIVVPGVARWCDIEQAFQWDGRNSELRMLHKLTSIPMQPKRRSKLRVGIAAQVLSHTVSTYLGTGYTGGFLPTSALATSRFVSQVDSMFDYMNGGVKLNRVHPWKAPVTRKSGHQEFWRSCRKLVDNWEFLEGSNSVIRRPPTVTGWLTTLAAMGLIWSKVAAIKKVRKLSTRRINQGPLENFFECIRAQCGSNRDPTMSSFMDAWKTCIFSDLAIEGSLKGTNCLGDGGNILGSFQEFDGFVPVTSPTSPPESPLTILDRCSLNSTADLCQVIARDGLQFSDCSYCRSGLLEVQLHEDQVWKYLRMDTVQGEEHYTYPSVDLVRSVSASMNLVLAVLDGGPPRVGVTQAILDRLKGSDSFGLMLLNPWGCGEGESSIEGGGEQHLILVPGTEPGFQNELF